VLVQVGQVGVVWQEALRCQVDIDNEDSAAGRSNETAWSTMACSWPPLWAKTWRMTAVSTLAGSMPVALASPWRTVTFSNPRLATVSLAAVRAAWVGVDGYDRAAPADDVG
jgi:hypothetical protein